MIEKVGTAEAKSAGRESWTTLQDGEELPPGTRIRIGRQSSLHVWVRPWGKLRVGPGSVVRIGEADLFRSGISGVFLESGRLSLEVPRKEEGMVYAIGWTGGSARLVSGAVWSSSQNGIVEIRPIAGDCQIEPGGLASGAEDAFRSDFTVFTLPAGEKASFKDRRANRRPAFRPFADEEEWAFTRPAPAEKDRPRFDPRGPW